MTPKPKKILTFRNTQNGFTLLELLIIITIIGILASLALPAYKNYSNRSKFTEAMLETSTPKNAITIALETKRKADGTPLVLTDLQAGLYGIAENTPQTNFRHGVNVRNGIITITWKSDNSELDAITFTLTPNSNIPPITWTTGGTCLIYSLC
jgi:type IV pilus assembly protein PilA